MHPRIDNPAVVVPGALKALQALGAAVIKSDVPETTLYLVELRASQINGCSICVDIHSHELKLAGERPSASTPSPPGAKLPTSPMPSGPPWH